MKHFEIWDHWTKLGDVFAYNENHAIRIYRQKHGGDWIKLFAYFSE